MKSLKILSLILISVLIFSCENEDFDYEATINSKPESLKSVLDKQTIIDNPYDVRIYIKNNMDFDDEKIQNQLLSLGLISRDLFLNRKLNSAILTKAKVSENSAISFSEILLNLDRNEKNYSELSNNIQNLDLTHKSQNPANKGFVEQYIPAIFVPNIEIADASKQPIISSGIEVNSEIKGLEKYEDFIVAWYYENGNWIEFLLNEEMAMKITNPIFIIDNAEKEITNRKKTVLDIKTANTNRSTYQYYYSHRYKINYRYESAGRSELYITGGHINNIGIYGLYSNSNGTFSSRRQLASVRKRHIGDWRWHYQRHSDGEYQDYTFWNTYERDWYRSYKWLGSPSRFGRSLYLSGRRAYSSQWYAYAPSQVNNNPLTRTSSKYYTNWKGGLLVQQQ